MYCKWGISLHITENKGLSQKHDTDNPSNGFSIFHLIGSDKQSILIHLKGSDYHITTTNDKKLTRRTGYLVGIQPNHSAYQCHAVGFSSRKYLATDGFGRTIYQAHARLEIKRLILGLWVSLLWGSVALQTMVLPEPVWTKVWNEEQGNNTFTVTHLVESFFSKQKQRSIPSAVQLQSSVNLQISLLSWYVWQSLKILDFFPYHYENDLSFIFSEGHFVFANRKYMYSGEVRSNHKWSLETRVESHSNARLELMYLELSTCDQITQDVC